MAFESLSDKLQGVFRKIKGKAVLSETDIDEAMREVKLALLEADVNLKVVKNFVGSVKEKALGSDVLESLTPAQQVIKIVNDELTALLGGSASKLTYSPRGFTVILMAGLQGSGKTTSCGKLAVYLRKNGKKPMLCACDIYRPAAIDQLEIVGKTVGVPVFTMRESDKPVDIAKAAVEDAQRRGYDVLIVDTAGRLHIDEELMNELELIKKTVKPHEILLVIDSMTGQDAVNTALGFDDRLGIDGVIITKLDGDARGGAALSVKQVTGKPIKFVGMGEKLDALEPFYPDRMAGRILGMGDMLSLIEKAQETFDDAQAEELERKLKKNEFTLDDFLAQMAQIKKMGGIAKIFELLPGVMPGIDKKAMKDVNIEEGQKEFAVMEAIILSMTPSERKDPSILNASRRKRISRGSGQPVSKINSMMKKYDEAKKLMKSVASGKAFKNNKMFRGF
ncbi:MAG: signal recognition particle protein [Eubacteriales bacterium]